MNVKKPAPYPAPVLKRNDKAARRWIWVVSVIIFLVIASLSRIHISFEPGFDPHIFATINAGINSAVAVVLIAALVAVKRQNYLWHKKLMITAIVLSVLFLISYIGHHLLSGDTKFGDVNHDNILSADEKLAAGSVRFVYYFLLLTHIPLAAIILPFILFTAYRGLSANYPAHKKLARIAWPIWFYVAVSGVIIYWMIKPYYT